jgi:hypothetical protein
MTCPFCGSDDIDVAASLEWDYECLECGAQLTEDDMEDEED